MTGHQLVGRTGHAYQRLGNLFVGQTQRTQERPMPRSFSAFFDVFASHLSLPLSLALSPQGRGNRKALIRTLSPQGRGSNSVSPILTFPPLGAVSYTHLTLPT